MGTTTNFNLPYPEPSNIPDGPSQIRALAEAVDNLLIPTDAPVEFGSHVEVVGNLGVQGDSFVEDLDADTITANTVETTNLVVSGNFGQWMDFDPNWTTSAGDDPAIGNGTLTGRYIQIGKLVVFNIVLVAGSTTNFGSGGFWQFNLPVQAAQSFTAACSYRDNSAPSNIVGSADCRATAGGVNGIIRSNVPSGTAVNASNPFVWASGDTYKVSGFYEAA